MLFFTALKNGILRPSAKHKHSCVQDKQTQITPASWWACAFKKPRPDQVQNTDNQASIYDDKTRKNWSAFHFVVKYKLLIPALCLFRLVMQRHLITRIPDTDYNAPLKRFDAAFETAIVRTALGFRRHRHKRKDWQYWVKRIQTETSMHMLRLLKRVVITYCVYDVFYREFMAVLQKEIAVQETPHRDHIQYTPSTEYLFRFWSLQDAVSNDGTGLVILTRQKDEQLTQQLSAVLHWCQENGCVLLPRIMDQVSIVPETAQDSPLFTGKLSQAEAFCIIRNAEKRKQA